MTDEDRQMLREHVESSSYSKLIITHGSDTLPDTASYVGVVKIKLSFLLGLIYPNHSKRNSMRILILE